MTSQCVSFFFFLNTGGSDTLMLGDRAADFPSRFDNGLNRSITITFYKFYYNVRYYFFCFAAFVLKGLTY